MHSSTTTLDYDTTIVKGRLDTQHITGKFSMTKRSTKLNFRRYANLRLRTKDF